MSEKIDKVPQGTWRIAERGNLYAVLEASHQSAYAYLWDKSVGVLSHVWLFNFLNSNITKDKYPPPMPWSNIKEEWALDKIGQISCNYNDERKRWDIFYENQQIAYLERNKTPGYSYLIHDSNEWACAPNIAGITMTTTELL